MGKVKRQFQPLLGQAIASIARVALDTPDSDPSPMMDTLLLTLKDGRNFELLVEQGQRIARVRTLLINIKPQKFALSSRRILKY